MVIKQSFLQCIINMRVHWKNYLKQRAFLLEHLWRGVWIHALICLYSVNRIRPVLVYFACVCLFVFCSPSLRCLISLSLLPASPPSLSLSLPLSRSLICFFDVEFKAAANVFFIWHTFCWASCPALLCKAGWRRMVMTLALWDSKWVKFKWSLYIRAPVNQTSPLPGLQA